VLLDVDVELMVLDVWMAEKINLLFLISSVNRVSRVMSNKRLNTLYLAVAC